MNMRAIAVLALFAAIVPGAKAQDHGQTELQRDTVMLQFLAQSQNADGSFGKDADGEFGQVGLTGLAVLTLLEAGFTHTSRDSFQRGPKKYCFGTIVKDSLRFLIKRQDADGCFSKSSSTDHAIATAALIRAFKLTASGLFSQPAENGIDRIATFKRSADGGFGLKPGDPTDREATRWNLFALRSAMDMGNTCVSIGHDLAGIAAEAMVALAKLPNPRNPEANSQNELAALQQEVDAMIAKLAAEEFETREQATKRLIEIGYPALQSVVAALISDDLEVRMRAEMIQATIMMKGASALDSMVTLDEAWWREHLPADAAVLKEVFDLIPKLGDEDFETRDQATTRLIEIGDPAVGGARKALDSNDPEVRMRARTILDAITGEDVALSTR